MDIVKIINGKECTFCLPASQYVAGCIKKNACNEHYDINVEFVGTGALLKKINKRKLVNYYDKEDISYIKISNSSEILGGFYWEDRRDLAVFYKTNTKAENILLKNEGMLRIPYEVFRCLRNQDIVEIKGNDFNKEGKEICIKFTAIKANLEPFVKIVPVSDDIFWYKISKDKFYRKKIENTPPKITKKKWKPKKGRG